MGYIISLFLNFVLGIFRFVINSFLKLFLKYIDICDCLLVGFLVWVSAVHGYNVHSGIAVFIALAVVTPLYLLFTHRVGFWIVTFIFSSVWSWAFVELIVKGLFKAQLDTIWYGIWFIAFLILNIGSHLVAEERNQKIKKELNDTPEDINIDNPTFHESDSKDFEYNPIADYQAVVDKERLRRKGKITE